MYTELSRNSFGQWRWRAVSAAFGLAAALVVAACTEDRKANVPPASGNVVAAPGTPRTPVISVPATAPTRAGIEPTEPAAPAATSGEKLAMAKAVQDEILTAMEKVTTEFEAAGIDSAKIQIVADKQKALAAAMKVQKEQNEKKLTDAEKTELEIYVKAKIMPLAARNIAARQKALETARSLSR